MTTIASKTLTKNPALEHLDDGELVVLARNRDEAAIRCLVRRHNQRLFRAARSVVGSDHEAEDVVQAAYVQAFSHLDGFRAEARFSTWLTRIAVNEALGRLRRRRTVADLEQIDIAAGQGRIIPFPTVQQPADPEIEMSRMEVRAMLERAVDELPAGFRAVFVLRDVEGLSVEETAEQLELRPETVRTRLHRARRLLRGAIEAQLSGSFTALFPFDGARCVAMADRVVTQLRKRAGC